MDINFYKKQTVLNDILSNTNTIVVNNSQLLSSINKTKLNKSEYLISNTGDINANYKNSTSNLTKLYISYYGIDPTKISITNDEIIENIKRYNNCEYSINIDESNHPKIEFKNGVQQKNEYNDYNKVTQTNSLLLDTTYNLLYYTQYDRMNLMAYHIKQINGFNYDNHMLYFNIDNEYICSLNNTLYYNFNKIKTTSSKDKGISLINPNFFNVKNLENNYYKNSAILCLNKKFKYDLFVTINKLKNIYYDCETMSDTLSYYANMDDYNNHYLDLVNLSYSYSQIEGQKICYNYISYVMFENTKLYYNDRLLGIDSLEIDDDDTLYINNLDNIDFKIGYIFGVTDNYDYSYINSYNMDLFKNRTSLIIDGNNINTKISYNYNYEYFAESITTSFIETSQSVWESQVHNKIQVINKENISKFPITTSYHINIPSTIDQTIFKNSGLNIIYKGSPYLSYLNEEKWEKEPTYVTYNSSNNTYVYTYWEYQNVVIPQKHELDIKPLNSKVFSHSCSKKSCIRQSFKSRGAESSGNHYYVLSSKNLFNTDNLKFKKIRRVLDGAHIYLRGTARDVNQEITSTLSSEVKIDNGINQHLYPNYRGLNFVAINKKTLAIVDKANYDTYGEAMGDGQKYNNGITLLKLKLNAINHGDAPYNTNDVFICLTSFDAIGWDGTGEDSLIRLLQGFGMGDLPYTETGRYPFLFMGAKGLGKGNGFTKMRNTGSWKDIVELSTNGDFGPQLIQGESTKIYLRGTAYDDEYGGNSDVRECIIQINDGDNLVFENSTRRSLHLVTIDKQTHEVIDIKVYDTYGEAGGDQERSDNGITLLKQKLNDIKNNIAPYDDKEVFVCLVSYDAIGWDSELISLLQEFGMGDLPYAGGWRYPFLFMGYKGLGKGNGFTKMNDAGSAPNEVELTTYIANNIEGKIQIVSPNPFQIFGLGNYNCYVCTLYMNEYIFNELYSLNVITKKSDIHYYHVAPLYIENYNEDGELIENIYNQNKEYIPILNNYPTKYLNDKFFDTQIYSEDNYPIKEELDTCISDIKDLGTVYGNNKLYLYEIYKSNNGYYLEFYTILSNNSKDNISESDITDISTPIEFSDTSKLLYNNLTSTSLSDKKRLYQYLSQYLNNFISF